MFATVELPPSRNFVENLIANFVENPSGRIDKVHDKACDKGDGCRVCGCGELPPPNFVVSLIVNFVEIPASRKDKVHDKVHDKACDKEGRPSVIGNRLPGYR